MPETLNDFLTQAAGNEVPTVDEPVNDTADDTVVDDAAVVDDVADTDVTTDDSSASDTATNDSAQKKKQEPKKNPMKEVRDRLTKETRDKERIEKAIQRFTDGDYKFNIRDFKVDGKVDYDALIKAMDDADLNVRANNRGMTPEIQAEVERIEREKQELQKERLKNAMNRAVANMQTDMQLKSEEVNKFFSDAVSANKNPYQWLAQGGSLEDLYYLIYKENVIKMAVDKAVADAQAKWTKEHNTVPPASNPAPASTPKGSVSLTDLLSRALN